MRQAKKQQRATEQLMAMLAANAGVDVEEFKKDVPVPVEESPFTTDTMQKELCLELINEPGRYMNKKCKYCGEFFGTSYRSVAYCSDLCRSREWEATMGVPWNFNGKSQREMWGGEPPRIIRPVLWKNLANLLETLAPLIENSDPPSESSDESAQTDPHPPEKTSQATPQPEPDFSETLQFDVELPVFEF